jgi:hypothetical protein
LIVVSAVATVIAVAAVVAIGAVISVIVITTIRTVLIPFPVPVPVSIAFRITVPVAVIVVITIAALILTIVSILRLGGTATGSTYPKNKSERHKTPANHFSQIIHCISPSYLSELATAVPICQLQIDRFGSPKNSQIFFTQLQEHFPFGAVDDADGRPPMLPVRDAL